MRIQIHKAERVTRNPPVNLIDQDTHLFRKEFEKNFKEVICETYGNVVLLSNGAVIDRLIKLNMFFCESIPLTTTVKIKSTIRLYLNSIGKLCKVRNVKKIKNGIFLTNYYSNNFFHWIGDVLQKLEALESQDCYDLNKLTLMIPASCYSCLARYTLKKYKIHYKIIHENQVYYIEKLFNIPLVSPTGNFRPELMKRMRQRFSMNDKESSKQSRIFITRKLAEKRKIINESEIYSSLNENGFEVLSMETLSIEEQIRVSSNAEILVGLHGAGLTHMMWMNEGTKVLEIRAEGDDRNNVYFSMASALDLKYYYVHAETIHKNLKTQKADFIIDPVTFEHTLRLMLQ